MTNNTGQLSESLEDYLEAIFNVAGEHKVARCRDIAETLKVSRSSVTQAMHALAEKGLVNYKPYSYVTLTGKGTATAAKIVQKHTIISSFFANVLGVNTAAAKEAACKAEHTLGPDVVGKLLCFIEFAMLENQNGRDLVGRFRRFCRERTRTAKDKHAKERNNK
jgi:DtxR family Mn-dependent transcriptional regulator